jgi:hypothetical protein
LVPADFRKLVSVLTAIGLAVAPTADNSVKVAADTAIRARLMVLLVFPFRFNRPRTGFNVRSAAAFKSPAVQKTFADRIFCFG